jgi:hypothetical protein
MMRAFERRLGMAEPTFSYPKEDPAVISRLRRPFLEWLCNFGLRFVVSPPSRLGQGISRLSAAEG